jgi:hypothetical protein
MYAKGNKSEQIFTASPVRCDGTSRTRGFGVVDGVAAAGAVLSGSGCGIRN